MCLRGNYNYWGWSVGSALIKVLMLFTEGHRFHHPPLPLIFYSVFSLYPHFVSYCKYRISSYNYWRRGSIDLEKGNLFITCVWCGVVWCEWCGVYDDVRRCSHVGGGQEKREGREMNKLLPPLFSSPQWPRLISLVIHRLEEKKGTTVVVQ